MASISIACQRFVSKLRHDAKILQNSYIVSYCFLADIIGEMPTLKENEMKNNAFRRLLAMAAAAPC